MKPIITLLFCMLCAASVYATDYMAEAEYYQKKADGYRREAEYYEKKAKGYAKDADEKAAMYLRWAAGK